jgi:hypothetical protein
MLISHMMSSPLNIQEMEVSAREKLPREVFDYYAGGAWDLQTLHENQDAYRRLRIHYRVLCDVSRRSMVCKIFDSELAMPILAAPTAFHRLVVTCDAPCWGVREADIRNGSFAAWHRTRQPDGVGSPWQLAQSPRRRDGTDYVMDVGSIAYVEGH